MIRELFSNPRLILWGGIGWFFLCCIIAMISIQLLKLNWIKEDLIPPVIIAVGLAGMVLTSLISSIRLEF